MKNKLFFVIAVIIATFSSYQMARFSLIKKHKKAKIEAIDDNGYYYSRSITTVEGQTAKYFEDKSNLLFVPMIFFTIIFWALAEGVAYLVTPTGKSPDDAIYGIPTIAFGLAGAVLIPLLVSLDIDIAYWIMR